MSRTVSTVVVVVPVHDEEALIGRCLAALRRAVRAARRRGIHCMVRIVLDDCRDRSAAVVRAHGATALHLAARNVGAARAAGVESGLREVSAPLDAVWIACTDADSAVPENWIVAQSDAAHAGADVFLGTVRPDFADLSSAHRRHWVATHPPGKATGNVHGASLGIRADLYRTVGGFAPLEEHEDVDLVDRCRAVGAAVHASAAVEVLTSGRKVGRTPGGYAGFLRDLSRSLDQPLETST